MSLPSIELPRRNWMVGAAACASACWFAPQHCHSQSPEYRPRVVLNHPLPPIKDPPVVSAQRADLSDNELVLGIAIGDQARAYPINQLTGPRREIINDQLAGTAIAATW